MSNYRYKTTKSEGHVWIILVAENISLDLGMLAVKKYVVPKPRYSLLSKVRQRALGTHLVPAVMKRCQVVTLRLIFPYGTREETVIQIAPRRRQIELALLE